MAALTPAQLELLKLFGRNLPESDIVPIKKLIVEYLSKKATNAIDKAFGNKGYSDQEIENWRTVDMRRKNE